MRAIITALLVTLTTPASSQDAQDTTLIYTETLGLGYVQDWMIADTQIFGGGIRTATVIGAGKSGSFKGELYIDCPEPAASRWLSVDDDLYLTASDVPAATIRAIRSLLCALN